MNEFKFFCKESEDVLKEYPDSRHSDLHLYAYYLMDKSRDYTFCYLLNDLMFSGKSPSTISRTRVFLQNKKGLYKPNGDKVIPVLDKPDLIQKLKFIWKILWI